MSTKRARLAGKLGSSHDKIFLFLPLRGVYVNCVHACFSRGQKPRSYLNLQPNVITGFKSFELYHISQSQSSWHHFSKQVKMKNPSSLPTSPAFWKPDVCPRISHRIFPHLLCIAPLSLVPATLKHFCFESLFPATIDPKRFYTNYRLSLTNHYCCYRTKLPKKNTSEFLNNPSHIVDCTLSFRLTQPLLGPSPQTMSKHRRSPRSSWWAKDLDMKV